MLIFNNLYVRSIFWYYKRESADLEIRRSNMNQQEQRLHFCGEDSGGGTVCLIEIFTPDHEYRITTYSHFRELKLKTYKNSDNALRYFRVLTRFDSRRDISEAGYECPYHKRRLHLYGEDRDGNTYCLRETFTPSKMFLITHSGPVFFFVRKDNALRHFQSLTRVPSRRDIADEYGELCPYSH